MRRHVFLTAVGLFGASGLFGCNQLSRRPDPPVCAKTKDCYATAQKPAPATAAGDKTVQRKPVAQKLAIPNRLPDPARADTDMRRTPLLPPVEPVSGEPNETTPLPPEPRPVNALPASQEKPQPPRLAPPLPTSQAPAYPGEYAPTIASGLPLPSPPLPSAPLPSAPLPPALLPTPEVPPPGPPPALPAPGVIDDSAWTPVRPTSPAGPPVSYRHEPSAIQQVSDVRPALRTAPASTVPGDSGRALVGNVQQWRNTWLLRYAAVDADAPFGGSVTLIGNADLNRLQDGQRVRVHGILVAPVSASQPAYYQVSSIEVLQ